VKKFILIIAIFALCRSVLAADKRDDSQLRKSIDVVNEVMKTPETSIPNELLQKAVCVGIVPSEVKFALGIGGNYGRGVLVCARAKEMSETQSGVARNSARPIQDLSDAVGRHSDLSRQFCGAHVECLQFLGQVCTRMDSHKSHGDSPNDNQQSPGLMAPAVGPATRRKSAIVNTDAV